MEYNDEVLQHRQDLNNKYTYKEDANSIIKTNSDGRMNEMNDMENETNSNAIKSYSVSEHLSIQYDIDNTKVNINENENDVQSEIHTESGY